MAIPSPHWPRWIFSSVAHYTKTTLDGIQMPLLVEGVDEREQEKIRAESHVELRLHGPETSELSKDYFKLVVEINCLVTQMMGGQKQNAYDIFQTCGVIQQALSVIPVYRFGAGPDDDQTLLGCLTADSGRGQAIKVYHFGQSDKDTRVRQSAVDGRFVLYLRT
jgi:hypothetical protein